MENFILSLNVVLPLFLIMAVGYLLRRIGLLDDAVLPKLNSLVFKAFLPMMLFNNIYHSDLESMMNPKLILTAVVSILVIFGVLCLVIPRIEKDGPRRGAMVQGIFRSNYIIFGVPIVSGVFGEQGLGVVSILSAFAIPLFNVLSVVALEIFSHGTVNKNRIVKGIVTNPLIIASLLGVVFLLAGIPIPTPVEEALADMSAIATPLGLVSLGGFFKFADTKRYLKQLIIVVAGRLVVCPAIFLPVFVSMGFRGVDLMALATMMGAPIAVSSFIMAQQQGADADLAGQAVVYTALFSIFTMFLIIFGLKQLALI
ncbi:MAG TPA: AEC family transporter [Firmicutes bacterium]|nr:AEC family transporter [Bacillota bacterium]